MPTEFTITKCPAFMLPDGNSYPTMQIAQRAAMLKLVSPADMSDAELKFINVVLDEMFHRIDDVRAILGATGRKPRKSKGNGATRKRKTAVEAAK